MISKASLSEQLLPNLYVKSVSLDTNYQTKTSLSKTSEYFQDFDVKKTLTPSDSITSRMRLSAKFFQNESAQNELVKFFDSEVVQEYDVYVHQITDKTRYEQLNNLLASQPESINLFLKEVSEPFVSTKVVSFKEAFSNSKQNLNIQSNTTQLPTEVLDDGTVLSEIIMDVAFDNVAKNTDFLGYIIISAVTSEFDPSLGISNFGPIASAPKKEIVILDGELQNQGLMFTIAPFPAGADAQALSKFGNPGDTWVGGVHVHEGQFMAGSVHNSEPHPFLEYSIVPIRKFIDNRVKDQIEKNVLNLTSTFESLIPNTTKYKTSINFWR